VAARSGRLQNAPRAGALGSQPVLVLPMPEDFWPLTRYSPAFPQQPSPPMAFTVKAHHESYFAVFSRTTMEEALAKANELVAAGYNAVTIQDENGFLYLESDFTLLGQKPTTEQ
jgi:hypothetical protein